MKLIVHNPNITVDRIVATYTYNSVLYTHEFLTPADIPLGDANIDMMARWLSIVHATYLFSIEYFDELVADFYLSDYEISFFEKLIFNGMAEYRYVNNIPISMATKISLNGMPEPLSTERIHKYGDGTLLLNGGGKDGMTSAILMNQAGIDFELCQMGTSAAQISAAKALGKKPFIFKRLLDDRRYGQKNKGHWPTSAAIAVSSLICAYLLGKDELVISNESSANEINMMVDGVDINHQYSKSFEFECDFSELLLKSGINIKYFSLLRPLHELQIVKLFLSEPRYYNAFISCNHGFRKGFWCLECAKCAFICLAINAISPTAAEKIFQTKNSINLPALHNYILSLIEPQTNKPFECVGTLEECQIAAKMILNNPNIQLDGGLRQAFQEHTSSISDQMVENFLLNINQSHNIPSPEYDLLLQIMRDRLANN